MKERWEKNKREISIGVIVSIITTLIIKCGDWLVKALPAAGLSITNLIYYSAAGVTNTMLPEALLGAIIGLFLGIAIFSITRGRRTTNRLSDICTNIENEDNISSVDCVSKTHPTEGNSLSDIKAEIKKGKRMSRILIFVVVIFLLNMSLFIIYPNELKSQFDLNIAKINPYVKSSDIIQLESDWACMKTKSDYERIYAFIDNVKAENNLP